MKKTFSFIVLFLFVGLAFAQTPEQILNRMNKAMNEKQTNGFSMILDFSIPIVGTVSTRSYTLGDKMCLETSISNVTSVRWFDKDTMWTYDPEKEEIVITKKEESKTTTEESEGNLSQFTGLDENYDVSIDKSTIDAWYIKCKLKKSNNPKDAPKRIDIVVDKDSYLPRSISTKAAGIKLTIREIKFTVTEDQVTFNPAKYPGVKIIDQR